MKCRDCKHAITANSKGDEEMRKMGYKSCAKARTPEERGRYIRGDSECMWPGRLK